MSKNNYGKQRKEEKGIEEFRFMYGCIRDALSQGVPEGCGLDETLSLMDQDENGIESLIDYEKVDQYFDTKYGSKTLKNVAIRAAQMYAPRYISKKIAQDFLFEMRPETDRPVRETDVYAWKTTDMDKYLGTIFFSARRRGDVEPLSYYVERGQNLENKVLERLDDDLNDICTNVSRYGEPASANKLAFFQHQESKNRFDFLEEAKGKYAGLKKLYSLQHRDHIGQYKKK